MTTSQINSSSKRPKPDNDYSTIDLIATEISQKKSGIKKVRNQYGQVIRPKSGKQLSNMDLMNELQQKTMTMGGVKNEATKSVK